MKLNKNAVDLLRAKQCLSVVAMVDKANVSSQSVYAGYKKNIDPVVIGKIAKALGVDPEEIILKEE